MSLVSDRVETMAVSEAGESDSALELTIVMPCLNEAETLGVCLDKAFAFLSRSRIAGEVVVADNGSGDGSQALARQRGARVVDVSERGYGAALLGGIAAARGRFVIMGDSDDSYDFSDLDGFVGKLREGYDLVMGNRFKGGIKPGAMPPLHRYLGNPVLTGIGRLFFGSQAGDFHCGLRGFSRASILRLGLRTLGMEFASEMVVKATLAGLRIAEVPTTLSKDGRSRPPHLRSWRDGWRHLRFLLLYTPRWLFLYPGLTLSALGLALMLALLPGPIDFGGTVFDVHSLLMAMGMIMVGLQLAIFFLLAKRFAINERLLPIDPWFEAFRRVMTLERSLILGGVMSLLGLAGAIGSVLSWQQVGFGALDHRVTMRMLIPALTGLIVGLQVVMAGFLAGVLDLKRRGN